MIRHTPALALFYLADMVIPFMLIASFASWAASADHGTHRALYAALPLPDGHWQAAASLAGLAIVMTVLSVSVRFGRHFAYVPRDLLYLPVFTAINTLLLMPIRIAGFMRMGHDSGWGTRGAAAYGGTRKLNPQAIIPYLAGALMLGIAVRVGV